MRRRVTWRTFSLVCAIMLSGLLVAAPVGGVATASAADGCAGFADVTTSDPACTAIATLVAHGIITGYATTPPRFGPGDAVQRAQMATFLVRALAWQAQPTGPRSFTDFGNLVAELRTASLILANRCDDTGLCAARGYEPSGCDARGLAYPCFGPNDGVTHAQVVSFLTRAFEFDARYAWQSQPGGAMPYSGVPTVHQLDVRTYYAYAGAIPDAPTTETEWSQPAPRAWVARVLFQALGLPPVTTPLVSISPASGPAGTTFVVSVQGVPAGSRIDWSVSCSGCQAVTGTFTLGPGQTSFDFTITTVGWLAGSFTASLAANGLSIGTLGFTVTALPPSDAAAQFKLQATQAINETLPSLQEVMTLCPGANPLVCQSKYDVAKAKYGQLGDRLFDLAGTSPSQCDDLFLRVWALRREGANWLNAPYTPNSQGWIDRSEAVNRAYQANLWLIEARRVLAQEPGSCR